MNRIELLIRRKLAKLSQGQLAKKLGISRGYIAMVESGRKPLTKNLNIKLVRAFRNQSALITTSSSRGVMCPECGEIDLIKLRDAAKPQEIVWQCKRCNRVFTGAEAWGIKE